jgi:hypothetical protein
MTNSKKIEDSPLKNQADSQSTYIVTFTVYLKTRSGAYSGGGGWGSTPPPLFGKISSIC